MPDQNTVTVTVSGPVGCGKSAICGEIEITLRAIGTPVSWNDEGEKNTTHADWATALDLYRPSVVIVEESSPLREAPALRAENERLRAMLMEAGEVLKPFATVAAEWESAVLDPHPNEWVIPSKRFQYRRWNAARALSSRIEETLCHE